MFLAAAKASKPAAKKPAAAKPKAKPTSAMDISSGSEDETMRHKSSASSSSGELCITVNLVICELNV